MNIKDIDSDKLDKFKIKALERYLNSNPKVGEIKLVQLLSESILHLRKLIENPKEKDTTWDNPAIQLKYAVEYSDNESELSSLIVWPEISTFDRVFYAYPLSFLLREMTDYVVVFKQGDKREARVSPQNEHLKNLTGAKREEYFRELEEKYFSDNKEPTLTLPFKLNLSNDKEPKTAKGSFLLDVRPLFVDLDSKKSNYLVTAGLDIKGYKPVDWSKEEKKEFWEALDKSFKTYAPQESFDFLKKLIEPEVKPIKKDKEYVYKQSKKSVKLTQKIYTNIGLKDQDYKGYTNEGGNDNVKWQGKGITYLVPTEYLSLFPGKKKHEGQGYLIPIPPKTTISALKGLDILGYMLQEENRKRDKTGQDPTSELDFSLKEYAKMRGKTEIQLERGGKFIDELKRDLISGGVTSYIIDLEQDPSFANYLFKDNKGGRKSYFLGRFYELIIPKPKSKEKWGVIFSETYRKYFIEGGQYYPIPLPVIQDTYTNEKKGYLYLFYRDIIIRYASNNPEFRGGVLRVSTLLDIIKIGDEIKAKPQRAFNVLCECICYAIKFKAIKEVRVFDSGKREKIKSITNLEKFKDWNYNDFKNEVLNDLGLTDIREAVISFNSIPQKELPERIEEPKQMGEYKETL